MSIREAVASGSFYSSSRDMLKKDLADLFKFAQKYRENFAEAVIAPHAGYVYSGKVAAIAINAIKKAENYIIVGPNHTGFGKLISLTEADYWQTPLGKVEINKEISNTIAATTSAEFDESAHLSEHSIEVILPFLQYRFRDNFKIVPIVVAEHRKKELLALGDALAELSKKHHVAIIVSSDFTHYEREDSAKEKDFEAINLICKLEIDALEKKEIEKRYSICGIRPIVMLMEFARKKSLKAELLHYTTSAEFSGDKSNVVGYAAIAFFK